MAKYELRLKLKSITLNHRGRKIFQIISVIIFYVSRWCGIVSLFMKKKVVFFMSKCVSYYIANILCALKKGEKWNKDWAVIIAFCFILRERDKWLSMLFIVSFSAHICRERESSLNPDSTHTHIAFYIYFFSPSARAYYLFAYIRFYGINLKLKGQ